MNPYEILGVSENADDETIKKAYRELVKKYHPDNYKDNPLSDLANEKLQKINEAYEYITKNRSQSKGYGSSQNNSYSYDSSYTYNKSSSKFAYVRTLISQRRFADADAELNRQNDNSAEWHYLKGCVCLSKGWHFEGINHIQTAVNSDPSNAEYRNMLNNIRMRQNSYNQMCHSFIAVELKTYERNGNLRYC